jgi:hypothetical protein
MGQHDLSKGQITDISNSHSKNKGAYPLDFVLDKAIFNNIFQKDIRRVYIYKKVERLGKAIHLITPAFAGSTSLRNRLDAIAIGLVDAAILPPSTARIALSRELLALSSILSIARTGGFLSGMNSEIITREAHALLQEIAAYEEPRLFLEETPSLPELVKTAPVFNVENSGKKMQHSIKTTTTPKGHIKDIRGGVKDRREAVLSVIRNKGVAHIKDISTLIRGVSEKTIQRELMSLIADGMVKKEGERRWSSYSLIEL